MSGSAMASHCPNVMASVGLHHWYKSRVKLLQKQSQTSQFQWSRCRYFASYLVRTELCEVKPQHVSENTVLVPVSASLIEKLALRVLYSWHTGKLSVLKTISKSIKTMSALLYSLLYSYMAIL